MKQMKWYALIFLSLALSTGQLTRNRRGLKIAQMEIEIQGIPQSIRPKYQCLLAGTTVLEDGSRRLQESQRIALETEEQGADILRSLVGQREQIENARNTVRVPTIVHIPCGLTLCSFKLQIILLTERLERSRR